MADEHRLRDRLIHHAHERENVSRRDFLCSLSSGIGSLVLTQNLLAAPLKSDEFFITRLKHSGDWNTDMVGRGWPDGSEVNLLNKLTRETLVRTKVGEFVADPETDDILSQPFLYMTGHSPFQLTTRQIDQIARALKGGAFLYGEDCGLSPRGGFNKSFHDHVSQLLPGAVLKPIPMDHELFHCMFDIDTIMGGDKLMETHLNGVEIDGRLAIVYTRNDYGCAWEGHPCRPGGETQRQQAFEVGMNLVTYCLTHA